MKECCLPDVSEQRYQTAADFYGGSLILPLILNATFVMGRFMENCFTALSACAQSHDLWS